MDNAFSNRYLLQRSAGFADKAEIHALRNGSAIMDDGLASERIAAAHDDLRPGLNDLTHWQETDLVLDGGAGSTLDSVAQRREILGNGYPFGDAPPSLEYQPSCSLVYEFCLAICNSPSLTQGEYKDLPRVFERLACVLAETYIGLGAGSHHLGWPRDDDDSTLFRDAIAPVHEKTREWRWAPEDELPQNPSVKDIKDGGLDLLAWKMIDDRVGSLFFLGHCACGQNWQDKFNDANPDDLEKWFKPMTLIRPPVRLFFTPHHVVDPLLREASRTAGIVLDRIRLTLLAGESDHLIQHQDLRRCIEKLVALVRDSATSAPRPV